MSCEDSNFNADIERVIFAWYQFLLMFVIPTAVMVYCYTIVIRVLWISTKQLAQMTQTNRCVQTVTVHLIKKIAREVPIAPVSEIAELRVKVNFKVIKLKQYKTFKAS